MVEELHALVSAFRSRKGAAKASREDVLMSVDKAVAAMSQDQKE